MYKPCSCVLLARLVGVSFVPKNPVGAREGGLLRAVVCTAVNKAVQSPTPPVAIRDTLELGPA